MNYREIGLRIQIAREDARLNQKELADLLGLSQSTLSNYEKGKRKFYLAQLQAIANQLGKPLDYFLRPLDTEFEDCTDNPAHETMAIDELSEIIMILKELPKSSRHSAYDYIRWLKSRRDN